MVKFNDVTKENIKERNPDCPRIPDHPYRILIIGGSGSAKTNSLLNLINHKLYTDQIYLCARDPFKAKYQFLINKRKGACLKHFNDSKAFIQYSNDMDGIYENIEKYNPKKIRQILIAFENVIIYVLSNEKLNPIVTEFFIRGRKLNISLF